jgi:hypothetical protein
VSVPGHLLIQKFLENVEVDFIVDGHVDENEVNYLGT